MTAIAHCLKKEQGKWIAAGGKAFGDKATAGAWAEEWAAEDARNRAYAIVVKL